MRLGLFIPLSVVALTLAAGCASTEPREAVDVTNDPAWQPPGQGDLAVADKPEVAKPVRKPRARALEEPNHAEIQTGTLAARKGLTTR